MAYGRRRAAIRRRMTFDAGGYGGGGGFVLPFQGGTGQGQVLQLDTSDIAKAGVMAKVAQQEQNRLDRQQYLDLYKTNLAASREDTRWRQALAKDERTELRQNARDWVTDEHNRRTQERADKAQERYDAQFAFTQVEAQRKAEREERTKIPDAMLHAQMTSNYGTYQATMNAIRDGGGTPEQKQSMADQAQKMLDSLNKKAIEEHNKAIGGSAAIGANQTGVGQPTQGQSVTQVQAQPAPGPMMTQVNGQLVPAGPDGRPLPTATPYVFQRGITDEVTQEQYLAPYIAAARARNANQALGASSMAGTLNTRFTGIQGAQTVSQPPPIVVPGPTWPGKEHPLPQSPLGEGFRTVAHPYTPGVNLPNAASSVPISPQYQPSMGPSAGLVADRAAAERAAADAQAARVASLAAGLQANEEKFKIAQANQSAPAGLFVDTGVAPLPESSVPVSQPTDYDFIREALRGRRPPPARQTVSAEQGILADVADWVNETAANQQEVWELLTPAEKLAHVASYGLLTRLRRGEFRAGNEGQPDVPAEGVWRPPLPAQLTKKYLETLGLSTEPDKVFTNRGTLTRAELDRMYPTDADKVVSQSMIHSPTPPPAVQKPQWPMPLPKLKEPELAGPPGLMSQLAVTGAVESIKRDFPDLFKDVSDDAKAIQDKAMAHPEFQQRYWNELTNVNQAFRQLKQGTPWLDNPHGDPALRAQQTRFGELKAARPDLPDEVIWNTIQAMTTR